MSIILIVLPLALIVVFAAVLAYVWAVRRGQFDDLTTPALRVLHDDTPARRSSVEVRNASDTGTKTPGA